MTEAQQKAKRKYLAKGKRLTVDFYPTEADLIEHLEKQPKKQTYIKDLIRADMEKEKSLFELFPYSGGIAYGRTISDEKIEFATELQNENK